METKLIQCFTVWLVHAESAGGVSNHREILHTKKENQHVSEENNMLKIKIELLLDMVSEASIVTENARLVACSRSTNARMTLMFHHHLRANLFWPREVSHFYVKSMCLTSRSQTAQSEHFV